MYSGQHIWAAPILLSIARHEKRHGKTSSYAKVHDIERNKENFDGYLNYSLNKLSAVKHRDMGAPS